MWVRAKQIDGLLFWIGLRQWQWMQWMRTISRNNFFFLSPLPLHNIFCASMKNGLFQAVYTYIGQSDIEFSTIFILDERLKSGNPFMYVREDLVQTLL